SRRSQRTQRGRGRRTSGRRTRVAVGGAGVRGGSGVAADGSMRGSWWRAPPSLPAFRRRGPRSGPGRLAAVLDVPEAVADVRTLRGGVLPAELAAVVGLVRPHRVDEDPVGQALV